MKLIAVGFSANTTLKGTLIALDDNNDPLGWESAGDWSSPRFQKESVSQFVAAVGVGEEKARALIFKALAEARRQAGIPTPGDKSQTEHKLPFIVVSGRQARDIEADAWSLLTSANDDRPEFFSGTRRAETHGLARG